MSKCFVIQPFDKGKFDQRYHDSYRPAIEKSGLEPYRIDGDFAVRVPFEDIEKGIRECTICFADISLDNPNVWYELGFAFASGKDVVMVCSDKRVGHFPFDIQHKQVIIYTTNSKGDYETLESNITNKINALLKTKQTVQTLNEAPVVDHEGLQGHEIALLIFTAENQFTSQDSISVYTLKDEMRKAGYTDIATGVSLRKLERKGMIETVMETDFNGNTHLSCQVTKSGEDWILSNQDQLVFRRDQKATQIDDALPF